jgi:uncharacterized membrane protein
VNNTLYQALLYTHILGVILLAGNITITAFWKVLADMSKDVKLIAFANRGVIIADWIFTLSGIVLTLVGGVGISLMGHWPLFEVSWLSWSVVWFVVAGLLWLTLLIPLQIRQYRAAKRFVESGEIPKTYWRDANRWITIGLIATVPLLIILYLMVVKP